MPECADPAGPVHVPPAGTPGRPGSRGVVPPLSHTVIAPGSSWPPGCTITTTSNTVVITGLPLSVAVKVTMCSPTSAGVGITWPAKVAFTPAVLEMMFRPVSVGAFTAMTVVCVGSGERKVTSRSASSPTHSTMESHTVSLVATGGTLAELMSVANMKCLSSSQCTPSLAPKGPS